jgi:hypothetical protein
MLNYDMLKELSPPYLRWFLDLKTDIYRWNPEHFAQMQYTYVDKGNNNVMMESLGEAYKDMINLLFLGDGKEEELKVAGLNSPIYVKRILGILPKLRKYNRVFSKKSIGKIIPSLNNANYIIVNLRDDIFDIEADSIDKRGLLFLSTNHIISLRSSNCLLIEHNKNTFNICFNYELTDITKHCLFI